MQLARAAFGLQHWGTSLLNRTRRRSERWEVTHCGAHQPWSAARPNGSNNTLRFLHAARHGLCGPKNPASDPTFAHGRAPAAGSLGGIL